MRPLPLLLAACLSLSLQAQATLHFRQWVGGQELGGAEALLQVEKDGTRVMLHREWLDLSRMGLTIRQELSQESRKGTDGRLSFRWSLQLSQMPLEGGGAWDPRQPGILKVSPKGAAPSEQPVPERAVLWPEDEDLRLKEAARLKQALRMSSFSFPTHQWSTLVLTPVGPDPLPGFPDAVRFKGEVTEGATTVAQESWISPKEGEVRQRSELGGLELWTQRAELPPPVLVDRGGFFQRTLKEIPPEPFLPWLPELTLRFEGGTAPQLLETTEQHALGKGRWRLSQAALPTSEEAVQMPQVGTPTKEDAPFLVPSPLLQFQDPAFDGLLKRLALRPGLSRWEIAKRVTSFVFDWIQDKDYSVGFASALEVCRNSRGDCTEHGVLAVALLRKLGVPARGVVGWVALDRMMGLHFWVEVKLGSRWVPVDPTFDQAPASAFRILLGTTDLADLGSVGWDTAAIAFAKGQWAPERSGTAPWGHTAALAGDTVQAPDGTWISMKGGVWSLKEGELRLAIGAARHGARATTRPPGSILKNAQRLESGGREGWWSPKEKLLWLDLGGRWLEVDEVRETQAYELLKTMRSGTAR